MGVTVRLPAGLLNVAGGQGEIEVQARTVREALDRAIERHPALRRHLYGEDGRLRGYVNVYLNEEDVRWGAGEAAGVCDGDVITVVPSVAGG